MFKFDAHVHTSEVSPCGQVKAERMVEIYAKAGYSGFVLTDHYNRGYMDRYGVDTWEEKTEHFLSGYRKAKAYGEKIGFNVLLGAELAVRGNEPNEYLLYGLSEEFLWNHPALYETDLYALRRLMTENGVLIFQAHPYRPNMTRALPGFLDGVEVFNGNPRHNSHNDQALQYALEHDLLQSSGSDAHEEGDVGMGGIMTEDPILTIEDFKNALRSKKATLIKNL